MNTDTVVDFKAIKDTKKYVEETNLRIFELTDALYKVMDAKNLDEAKLLAADILGEDLETYMEDEEVLELDFDANIVWEDIKDDE